MNESSSILVIDVGSSGVRATVIDADGAAVASARVPTSLVRTAAGTAEIDAVEVADAAITAANRAIAASPVPPIALGITAQRASTVLFDRTTGAPCAPALSWQDIRTTGRCLALRANGLHLQPSQSATKLSWLLERAERDRPWAFGTLETYVAHRLTEGRLHVTDPSNAAVTGLVHDDASTWDDDVLHTLAIPPDVLPTIVDSIGVLAPATALVGAPLICGVVGDQQASLIGQGGLCHGDAKLTFGTGGMLDVNLRGESVGAMGGAGTFPVVLWRSADETVFGREAMMLSAGVAVDWLVDGLGVLPDAAASETVASGVRDAGGVVFVPALSGMGAPLWDLGARGALVGISGATTRAEIVRAVLDGVAQRGADLVDAAEADTGLTLTEIAVDGGMSKNALFVQLVADATGRPILRSAVADATTLGAAILAGVGVGVWDDLASAAAVVVPERSRIEPSRRTDRGRWLELRERALRTVPALSSLSFF